MRRPISFLVKLCISGALLTATAWSQAEAEYTITTIAGSGEEGFSGDSGPAVQAKLRSPLGVAVDAAGNLYIADTLNHRIRRVDASGTITTFAGTREYGFSGDGGPAVQTELSSPQAVAVDAAGNLYIADTNNHRIRRVDASGTITTFAGTREYGFSGDGGPAVQAKLYYPWGVAVDAAGNVYIADFGNLRIRRVDPSGTIATFAGTGELCYYSEDEDCGDGVPAVQAKLRSPRGVAVDAAGNLYINDTHNDRIRRVDPSGTITTVAGTGEYGFSGDGGPAVQAKLRSPEDVAVDGAGNLYIADTRNHRIRRVDASGTITTIAGNGRPGATGDGGPAVQAKLRSPQGVAVDAAGNLYIADWGNLRVRILRPPSPPSPPSPPPTADLIDTIAGTGEEGFSGDGGRSTQAQLAFPYGVAVDGASNLFIADSGNHRIRRVDPSGTITTIAGSGEEGFSGDSGPAVQAQLNFPHRVAVDGAGNLYIADTINHRIRRVDPSGTITTVAGTKVPNFVYGGYSGDGGPAVLAQLALPNDVAADSAGNLYIADYGNERIRRVDPSGTITTVAGTGESCFDGEDCGDGVPAIHAKLTHPYGVAVDGAGNLLIVDTGNDCIRRVDPSGTITTIAGTCKLRNETHAGNIFSGDGGPAVQAQLFGPRDVEVDGASNFFIVDYRQRSHSPGRCQRDYHHHCVDRIRCVDWGPGSRLV